MGVGIWVLDAREEGEDIEIGEAKESNEGIRGIE